MKIVQMTSVHPATDTRVFVKMSASVAACGHEVHLVVPCAAAEPVAIRQGVHVHAVAPASGRLSRMATVAKHVLDVARDIGGDLYQFHDPEFLPHVVRFQERTGAPVVFDSHEDYRLDLQSRHYIPRVVRPLVGSAVGFVEDGVVARLAGVIAATPSIRDRFLWHPHCCVIQNFPIRSELETTTEARLGRARDRVGFVGTICEDRGVLQMIEAVACAGPEFRLELAGAWSPVGLRERARAMRGWSQVDELGFLDRSGVRDLLGRVFCGLIVMLPIPSFVVAYPVKMFEYMAAGIPVIASDFPLWRSIVEEADCGILVDPHDPRAIGAAIRRLASDVDFAEHLGRNGRLAIAKRFNWEVELAKLTSFYDEVAAAHRQARGESLPGVH